MLLCGLLMLKKVLSASSNGCLGEFIIMCSYGLLVHLLAGSGFWKVVNFGNKRISQIFCNFRYYLLAL